MYVCACMCVLKLFPLLFPVVTPIYKWEAKRNLENNRRVELANFSYTNLIFITKLRSMHKSGGLATPALLTTTSKCPNLDSTSSKTPKSTLKIVCILNCRRSSIFYIIILRFSDVTFLSRFFYVGLNVSKIAL